MKLVLDPLTQKWKAKLRVPSLAVGKVVDGVKEFAVRLAAVEHSFHPELDPIRVWTYASGASPASFPGVTIEAEVGLPVRVSWLNDLRGESLAGLLHLGVRQGMEEQHMLTLPHNQIHLHGARVPWTSDGAPMNVFHPNEVRGYYYPNNQAAGTLWYHDHAMDVTRLNVYAGLAGMYLLREQTEKDVLPTGKFEVPLLLQDRSFLQSKRGVKLRYEQTVTYSAKGGLEVVPEFIGDYPVVNGSVWPVMKAKRAVYRWRVVNGANTRYFNLKLTNANDPTAVVQLHIVGTDGGFLTKPVPVDELLLAPGERADILVDLRNVGASLVLRNDAGCPYPSDGPIDPTDRCSELMRIEVSGGPVPSADAFDPGSIKLPKRVDPLKGGSHGRIPSHDEILRALDKNITTEEGNQPDLVPVVRSVKVPGTNFEFTYRRFVLEEYQLPMPTLANARVPADAKKAGVVSLAAERSPTVLINGETGTAGIKTGTPNPEFIPVAEPVRTTLDTFEVWEFVNATVDSHPMHIHLVQVRVLERLKVVTVAGAAGPLHRPEPKTVTGYTKIVGGVAEFETGWKDTVRCGPSEATRLLMRFDGYVGEYVYHCHILEHEDMGMMFELSVEP
jgi:spore coat protein A, manganese oxidase